MNARFCLVAGMAFFLLVAVQGIRWHHEPTVGDEPLIRSGGQMVTVGRYGVLFGGAVECFNMSSCDNFYHDDMHVLDFETNVWTMKSLPATRPSPRIFHGAARYKNEAIFFAGARYNAMVTDVTVYDDMWAYNPYTNNWRQITFNGNSKPGARIGMEIEVYGDTVYAFGGFDMFFQPHNDMWKFNLLTSTWTQLYADSEATTQPGGRFIYTFQLDERTKRIWIFGGNQRDGGAVGTTVQFNDTWYYDINSNQFVEVISTARSNIPGRTHTVAAIHHNTLYLALGDIPSDGSEGCIVNSPSSGQNPTNIIVALDISRRAPDNVLWEVIDAGFSPTLKRPAFTLYENKLFITKGFGYTCPSAASSTPIWNDFAFSLKLTGRPGHGGGNDDDDDDD